MARLPNGLTIKQETFARAFVANGGNAQQAYTEAYSTGSMSIGVINNEGYRLAKRSDVSMRIGVLEEQRHDADRVTREYVIAELDARQRQALAAGNYPASIRALELLGRAVGMFNDVVPVKEQAALITSVTIVLPSEPDRSSIEDSPGTIVDSTGAVESDDVPDAVSGIR